MKAIPCAKVAVESDLARLLAICRKVIEAHGGKIWAENRPEGGTVFCFTLPIAKKKKK